MKPRILVSLVFFGTLCTSVLAQAPTVQQWDARVGGTALEVLIDAIITRNGGVLLSGYSNSDSTGTITQGGRGMEDYYAALVDENGTVLWNYVYGGAGHDHIDAVHESSDGGFLLGGHSSSGANGDKTDPGFGGGGHDCWLIKVDSAGQMLWDKCYGGNSDDRIADIVDAHGGGYLLLATSVSPPSGNKTTPQYGAEDLWVVHIDEVGNILWQGGYGGSDHDKGGGVVAVPGGGYLIGSWSRSDSSGTKSMNSYGDYDLWAVRIDDNGIQQWDVGHGGADEESMARVAVAANGDLVLAGVTRSGVEGSKQDTTLGASDIWIVRMDSEGDYLWDRTLGGNDEEDDLSNLALHSSGGMLIGAAVYSSATGEVSEDHTAYGDEQVWAALLDDVGDMVWDKTIFTNGHEEAGFVLESEEGCVVAATYTASGTAGYVQQTLIGSSDLWCTLLCTSPAGVKPYKETKAVIYPNPTQGSIYVVPPSGSVRVSLAEVLSMDGTLVRAAQFPTTSEGPIRIDLEGLPPGLYCIRLGTASGTVIARSRVVLAGP